MVGQGWDETCDVLVVGSGAGLTGAYIAATRGLKTIVLESTDMLGGTTAYSGGGLWLPESPATKRANVEGNSVEGARTYFRAIIGDRTPAALQDAYLENAAPMIIELETNPRFAFEHYPYPDYFHDAPGFLPLGRDTFPVPLPTSELGDLVALMRPPLGTERAGVPMPDTLMSGASLIARLLLAIRDTGNVEFKLNTPMDRLIVENGRVVGVEAVSGGKRLRFRAERGVLIAAGGFERNAAMRKKYGIPGSAAWSSGGPGGTGRPIEAGMEIGAAVDLMNECWWTPGVRHPDGSAYFAIGTSGGIFVNDAGQRFCNEAKPYDQIGRSLIAAEKQTGIRHSPFWFVYDARFEGRLPVDYSAVPILDQQRYYEAGLLKKADTLAELARQIDVPVEALEKTVERFNGFVKSGVDSDFHRGESSFDKFFAVSGEEPNKALVPIDKPPYFAAALALSDLGTKGGLKTDEKARVLKTDGAVIPGLYAAGNSMAAVTGTVYPGPGCPVGASMVFSYIAALDMAGG